ASASEDLRALLTGEREDTHAGDPIGALLFSCNGRGQRFFRTPHHDVTAVREKMGGIPVGGFFAMGEIGPVGGNNFLHGYPASVTRRSAPAWTITSSCTASPGSGATSPPTP